MPRVIILDTFPLSNMARREVETARTVGEQCQHWVRDCLAAGNRIVAPSICYFEVLREMERLDTTAQIERLRSFCFETPNRFLSITDEHLESAAKWWAQARQNGTPTASPEALDVDVILAAQTLSPGLQPDEYVVATTNVGHLAQFVNAERWTEIAPGS